ncbi:MAG: Wzz/FepE/Etk N-terminal domain-containing protein [Rhizobiaceae bacterium]
MTLIFSVICSMAANDELNRDIDIDLGGIFASIWRNKFKLLIASLLMTVLAFVVLQSISPRYRSQAHILIRAAEPVLSTPRVTTNPNQSDLDDQGIASKIQLIQSREIARKIIGDLNLKADPEFDGTLNRSPIGHILSSLGLVENGGGLASDDRVMESYYEKLKVFQAERSRVIVVQFSSTNPKLAAEIPNMIADEYMALQERLKRGATPEDLDKLQSEVVALSSAVKVEEAAMSDFRRDKDLLQGSNNNTLATQELSELATELGRVRSQLSRAKANAASVREALNSGSLDTAVSVLQSPLIQRLRERQVNLSTQLSELSITLLPNHPRIQGARSQMATLKKQISREALKIESSLQQQARVAQAREKDLITRRAGLKKEAARVDREQVELQEMERELVAKRQLLSQFTLRLKAAQSRQARKFLPADAYIFSRAQVQAKSYFPKKLPILAGTFFGTFLLGSMLALIGSVLSGTTARAAYMDRHISDQAETLTPELAREVGVSVSAPSLAPDMQNLTTKVKPVKSNVAIAAKSIKSLGRGRVAVITPQGEGRSEGTVILARYLADQGASVIVLDMTVNSSATNVMLAQSKLAGIKELLNGECSFAEAIHRDTLSSAHIMPTGDASVSIQAKSGEKLPAILASLHHAYEFVIIDCGKVGASGLKRVSNEHTMNIISVNESNNDEAYLVCAELVEHGYATPLLIHTSAEELKLLETAAA